MTTTFLPFAERTLAPAAEAGPPLENVLALGAVACWDDVTAQAPKTYYDQPEVLRVKEWARLQRIDMMSRLLVGENIDGPFAADAMRRGIEDDLLAMSQCFHDFVAEAVAVAPPEL